MSLQIDSIMWYFFSQCLLESEPSSDTVVDYQYLATTHVSDSRTDPSSSSSTSHSESSPTTGETSSGETSPCISEASPPSIPVSVFTCLLGALLTDQSSLIASSSRASFVRFLCRLNKRPFQDPDSPSPSASLLSPLPRSIPLDAIPDRVIDSAAAKLILNEFIIGIVVGLANLCEDEGDEVGKESTSAKAVTSDDAKSEGGDSVMSEAEDAIKDEWLDATVATIDTDDSMVIDGLDSPLRSFFDDDLDRPHDFDLVIPFEPVYPSGYGNDSTKNDEECTIGSLCSMTLISAIGLSDCLESEMIETYLLPEIERMKSESMFYIRKGTSSVFFRICTALTVMVH